MYFITCIFYYILKIVDGISELKISLNNIFCDWSLPVLCGHILPKKVDKPVFDGRTAVQPSLLVFCLRKKCYESTCYEDS